MTQDIDKLVSRAKLAKALEDATKSRDFWKSEYLNASADAAKFANENATLTKRLEEADATFDARVQEMSERFRAVNVAEALKQLGPDHLALAAQAEDLRAELEAVKHDLSRYIEIASSEATHAAKLEAENGRKNALLVKASIGFEPFAEVGQALIFAGATATDEIELSGEQLRPALIAAVQIKREIDAALTGREG